MNTPARQNALEPGESIGVRMLLKGDRPEAKRAGVMLEVTALCLE